MKKIFLVIMGFLLWGVFSSDVSAETISYKKLDNIYFNLKVNGNSSSNYVTMFYLDNRLAYCIDPGVEINTRVYNSSNNWGVTNISAEKQKYLEKIGYYGYEYPNHQTDKYYIAAQELIWEAIKDVDSYFTTGPNGTGSRIDISREKNEILALVKKHDIVPSFVDDTLIGSKGTTLTFEDENKVLDDYDISGSNHHKIERKSNSIVVGFSADLNEDEITLTRKSNYNDLLLVYTMAGSQSLASLRISSPDTYSFKIKSIEVPSPPKEIVKVPSTGIGDRAINYNVIKFYKYDFSRFN